MYIRKICIFLKSLLLIKTYLKDTLQLNPHISVFINFVLQLKSKFSSLYNVREMLWHIVYVSPPGCSCATWQEFTMHSSLSTTPQ